MPNASRFTITRALGGCLLAGSVVVAGGCQSNSTGLRTANQAAAPTVSEALGARAEAIAELTQLSENVRPAIRANAIEAFAWAPQDGEEVILAGLRDSNEGVRAVSAMVVGRTKMQAGAGWLKPLELDDSPYVRAAAVYGLSKLGEPVNPTPLGTMLLESRDPRTRSHAAFILGELGDPSAAAMLQEAGQAQIGRASQAELRLFRLQVAEAQIKLGDESLLPGVRAALYPSRPEELEITALALQIIGSVGDRGSIDQLIYLAEGQAELPMPPEIRLAAADALARLGFPQGGFVADEFSQDPQETIRSFSAVVYGRTDSAGNLAKLRGMLQDASPMVRAAAGAGILELTGSAR